MKNHTVFLRTAFDGESSTGPEERVPESKLGLLWNAICTPERAIEKWDGLYPVATAEVFGIQDGDPRTKVWNMSRSRGTQGKQRALDIVGGECLRSGANNLYDPYVPITFPTSTSTPALNQPCAIASRLGYSYVSNIDDIPFRVKMEEDDGSAPSALAEILGLKPPLHGPKSGGLVAGTTFPPSSVTEYAVTFVYGDRGESGPSPLMSFIVFDPLTYDSIVLTYLPIGGPGVTARRIYRSRIGTGSAFVFTAAIQRNKAYRPATGELFLLAEIPDNTTTSYTDGKTATALGDDSALDYGKRLPPPRPFTPRAKYMVVHQDRFVWANLRDNPLVFAIVGDPSSVGIQTVALTVSNTGNGTITIVITGGAYAGTKTVSNYKTKSLKAIWAEIIPAPSYYQTFPFNIGGVAGENVVCRVAPGVNWDRTYVFREVVSKDITTDADTHWFEAIDGDAVAVDGCAKYPNGLMFSNAIYPEEINPLNVWFAARHDAYPATGLAHNDHTCILSTNDGIFTLSGSLSVNERFEPDFTVSRTQAEFGSYCPRPDAMVWTPEGLVYVGRDGVRIFKGQTSVLHPAFYGTRKRLMHRIKREARARDNVFLHYRNGITYIWYPGVEVA